MNLVDNLSDDASQLTRLALPDGSLVVLALVYQPATQRWTVSVTRNDFTVNNMNLCVHPNLLREWREVIPFGLAITSTDGGDPVLIDDFISGRIQLYVLTAADVIEIENNVFGALV